MKKYILDFIGFIRQMLRQIFFYSCFFIIVINILALLGRGLELLANPDQVQLTTLIDFKKILSLTWSSLFGGIAIGVLVQLPSRLGCQKEGRKINRITQRKQFNRMG